MRWSSCLATVACVATTVSVLAPVSMSAAEETTSPHRAGLIAFTRSNPERGTMALVRSRPDGSHLKRLVRGPAFFPDWSPDRRRVVFDFPDAHGNEQIAVVRRNGSRVLQLTDLPGISEVARYSPDGDTLVFDRSPKSPDEPGFFTSLWVMDADGSDAHALFRPDPRKFDVEPEFSPDGRRIVFSRLRQAGSVQRAAIFVVGANGRHERRITTFKRGLEHPRWSPDGRHIVFDIELPDPTDPASGIWQVRVGDRRLRQILPGSPRLFGFKPDYSPNGRRILFGCFIVRQQQDDLCVMRADGSHVRNITRTPRIFENFPVWD